MKLIKKGREQKGWSKEFKCTGSGNGNGGCGAVLLVEEDDLYHTYSWARDERTVYTTFRCTECGVQTDVTVPSSVNVIRKREVMQEPTKFEIPMSKIYPDMTEIVGHRTIYREICYNCYNDQNWWDKPPPCSTCVAKIEPSNFKRKES